MTKYDERAASNIRAYQIPPKYKKIHKENKGDGSILLTI